MDHPTPRRHHRQPCPLALPVAAKAGFRRVHRDYRRHKGGPVDNYLTLKGGSRPVEIGAFLSVAERRALFGELSDCLRRVG
jgi:hypothetical protein